MAIGTIEDCGRSLLICDNEACEAMFSKEDGRHHDGDPCPVCAERQPSDDDVIRAANRYGRV